MTRMKGVIIACLHGVSVWGSISKQIIVTCPTNIFPTNYLFLPTTPIWCFCQNHIFGHTASITDHENNSIIGLDLDIASSVPGESHQCDCIPGVINTRSGYLFISDVKGWCRCSPQCEIISWELTRLFLQSITEDIWIFIADSKAARFLTDQHNLLFISVNSGALYCCLLQQPALSLLCM